MKKYTLGILALVALTACNRDNNYDATGTFEATEVVVSSEANGRILNLDINEGDVIEAGEQIGIVDTIQLSLQLAALRQQQNAILSARPDVNKQVATLREQIAKQEKELARAERMQQGGATTQKQVDDIASQLTMLRGQLDATLATLTANISSADHNASALEIQMAQLQDRLNKCHITSPISGTVLLKYAQTGEVTASGKPIIKVADLENIYLRAYFTSDQLSRIQLGQEVTVIADFGDDEQYEYPGTVTWIASDSEFTPKGIQTRGSRANLVYATKIAVKNDGRLKLGLYGEVRL